jgi:hypothetical protein
MGPASAITAIGATHGRKFIAHKMLASGAAMAAPAKNANLVNKIAFLQYAIFAMRCKYTLTIFKTELYEIPGPPADTHPADGK